VGFFFLCKVQWGQSVTPQDSIDKKIEQLMKLKPIRVKQHPQAEDSLAIPLEMYFSSSEFLPKQGFKLPPKKDILSVHLVYTRYRQVDTFNQPKLNENRYYELSKKLPDIFYNTEIEWLVFEQTQATTEEDARKMFHGFVIYLRNPPNKKLLLSEFTIIDELLLNIKDSFVRVPDQTIYRTVKRQVETGRYIPRRSDKQKKGIRYENSGIWMREPETKMVIDSVKRRTIKGHDKYIGVYKGKASDRFSTELYNLLRNKTFQGKWAFVIDVTGSMAPYTGQVLSLLKHRPTLATEHHYAFFNDGNGAPEILKRVGNSGGVYTVKTSQFDTIYQTLLTAMKAGDGGDIPENNVEAILRTLKQWPHIDTVLMIADAGAPVKDLKILNFVNKPVQLVLCGDISKLILMDYVRIAIHTKGSILTSEGEIKNLHNLKVGEVVEVGATDYVLTFRGLEAK
jgi:hypothetical protein